MSEEVRGALPSLISLMVSVDVKPYVILLLRVRGGWRSSLVDLGSLVAKLFSTVVFRALSS